MLNKSSLPFKGAIVLTTANANQYLAVRAAVNAGVKSDFRETTVTLSRAHASENYDEIIGVYGSNPGHEDNEVSIDVTGVLIIQVAAAITQTDHGKGVVSGVTAGVAEVGPALIDGAAKVGFGKIIGGYTENDKHYAILLVT